MFILLVFEDYRKEVTIECLGYASELEKAKLDLFQRVVNAFQNSNAFTVLQRVRQTEYVSLINSKSVQYQPVVIHTSSALTIKQFLQTFLPNLRGKVKMGLSALPPESLVTQEWLSENMAVIAEHFELFLEEEDEEDEEDEKKIKCFDRVNRYCNIYAIIEI